MSQDKKIEDLINHLTAVENLLGEMRKGLKDLHTGGLTSTPKHIQPVPPASGDSCK
jgi:hypothetical protein